MRYFLEFSYRGTAYHGWQMQPNAITVQQVLTDCLSNILGNPIDIMGAGRTDSGVHATQMFAHFDSDKVLDTKVLKYRLNSFLPQDISIKNIFEVNEEAHARFDATERTYHYKMHFQKNSFWYDLSWYWNYTELNVEAMNSAAEILLKKDDFTSFAKLHSDNKTNTCKVTQAQWNWNDEQLIFTISADRFLRNMVRSIVGTLVLVGQQKMSLTQFESVIDKKDRKFAGASAPAHGLYLTQVQYPQNVFL